MTRRDLEKLRVALRGLSGGNLLVIVKAGDRTRAKGQTRVPIVYTKGVSKRGMSVERFVAVTATNAAKVLGLYPRKGAIAPGSDADLVVFDASVRKTLGAADLHGRDYSAWEGWEVHGWPEVVLLRGRSSSTGASSAGRIVSTQALSAPSVPRELGGGPPWRTPVSRRHPAGEGERHASGSRSPSGCDGDCSSRGTARPGRGGEPVRAPVAAPQRHVGPRGADPVRSGAPGGARRHRGHHRPRRARWRPGRSRLQPRLAGLAEPPAPGAGGLAHRPERAGAGGEARLALPRRLPRALGGARQRARPGRGRGRASRLDRARASHPLPTPGGESCTQRRGRRLTATGQGGSSGSWWRISSSSGSSGRRCCDGACRPGTEAAGGRGAGRAAATYSQTKRQVAVHMVRSAGRGRRPRRCYTRRRP